MSDEDRIDLDIDGDGMMGDSDDDDMDEDDLSMEKGQGSSKPMTQAEKRAHHNALERKRRDHIKDSFTSLRDSVPSLQGEKSSRAQILKKAADYIQFMRRKNSSHQHDIEDLKRQNSVLESQSESVRGIERARLTGSFSSATATLTGHNTVEVHEDEQGGGVMSFMGGAGSTSVTVAGGSKKIKVLSVGSTALK